MFRLASSIVYPWLNRRNRDTPERRAARVAALNLRPTVVITGGSRGIGLALARVFLNDSCFVLLVARGQADLDTAHNSLDMAHRDRCSTLALDVTAEGVWAAITQKLKSERGYLDVLVNNAAIGLSGTFEHHANGDLDRLVALNIAALTRLTHLALPEMIARGRGGIVNMSSLGAYVPGPNQAAYYASKAYVLSLSEAIASEVSGSGVKICAVAPGPVNTRFHADMNAETALYRMLLPALSPDAIARAIYRAFTIGQRVVVPGLLYRLAFLCLRVLPHFITVPLTGWLLKNSDRQL